MIETECKYIAVTFADSITAESATFMGIKTSCRNELTWYFQAISDENLELKDPKDDGTLLSMRPLSAIPDFDSSPTSPNYIPACIEDTNRLSEQLHLAAAMRLFGKYLPSGSDRRKALQAIAGIFLRDETSVDETAAILVLIAKLARDAYAETYYDIAHECKLRLDKAQPVAGIPKLKSLMGDDVVQAGLMWMGLTSPVQTTSDPNSLDARCSEFLRNDMGNAERIIARFGHDMRYCHPWATWLTWNGERWAKDETNQVMRWARETVRCIHNEAASVPVKKNSEGKDVNQWQRDALLGHALGSGSHARLEAMIKQAQSFPEVSVVAEQLDANPWLLNVLNGTIDLRHVTITPHRREDLQTKQAPVAFDPKATCPLWHAFLERVLPDPAMQDFVKRFTGYTLTGTTTEQCLAFLYGSGANGKSVFTGTFERLLGDYWAKTCAETLMVRKNASGINNDVAALIGKRLVTVSEIGEGERLNEALVKDLTGNDAITARFLYGEFFTFRPAFAIWMYGNHKPTVRGNDDGIWRRMRLIPFLVKIPPEEKDPNLSEKLHKELSGILNWALEGCRMWLKEGIVTPDDVKKATQEYRDDSDAFKTFIEDRCVTGDTFRVTATALYDAYKEWCGQNGEHVLSQIVLGKRLKDRGFENKRDMEARFWKGLRLDNIYVEDGREKASVTKPAPVEKTYVPVCSLTPLEALSQEEEEAS